MTEKRKETVDLDAEEEPKRQKVDEDSSECMLVADNRERVTVGEELLPFVVLLKRHREWVPGQLGAAQLPLGDFVFMQRGEIRMIMERKTIRDLVASLTGLKRLEEQESRLIQAKIDAPETVVGLIIEGSLTETDIGQYNQRHMQNQLWAMSKVNIQVIYTKDFEETCSYVCYMRWSLSQENNMADAQNTQLLSMTAYAKKKKGLQPKDTYPNFLKSIPGISACHVAAIMEQFPTLVQYLDAFVDNPQLFDGFHLTEKRKMGKVLSEKLHKYTFGFGEDI
jgi:ERCC4-type nuclease